ncbi:hypothetical protein [Rhodopila sp.]|jgi:hypothetical protein|uniref:hypothetical protein n=1 Tax=Rhodopila sp. TaxID=2480087 RepID=UPI002C92BC6C|nr:hypothetical protein [Rhodopila sp.]HVZ08068.1 hypothetical protein [Rhodopila sp.]
MSEPSAPLSRSPTPGGSATIIPFRARPAASPSRRAGSARVGSAQAGFVQAGSAQASDPTRDRLARALATLNAALVDQRLAMAQWRSALAELKASAAGLGDTLVHYQANLASLSQGVSALRLQAKSLAAWADRVAPERS